ncbi:MAG TPA: SpoIIE family protein phosphatase [Bacteroidia bacterium]|nr:SpoIIE family protein phosphatase [Bacteroidia bacterium]
MNKRYFVFFISILLACQCFSTNLSGFSVTFNLDSVHKTVNLDTCWKFHGGDDIRWASASFDDKEWDTLFTNLNSKHAHELFKGIGWFRLHLKVSSKIFYKPFVLKMEQEGASDIYLNGKKVTNFGKVSVTPEDEYPFNPLNSLYLMQLGGDTSQVIAIRYSAWKALEKKRAEPGFSFSLAETSSLESRLSQAEGLISGSTFFFAMFLTLGVFHLLLFLFHRKAISNLYYFFMVVALAVFWLYPAVIANSSNPFISELFNKVLFFVYAPFFTLMVILMYSMFSRRYNALFWCILATAVIADIAIAFELPFDGYLVLASIIFSSVESTRIAIIAVKQKKPGSWIIASGFILFVATVVLITLWFIVSEAMSHQKADISSRSGWVLAFIVIWAFSIPTSMSVYLASDFSRTNKNLALQLVNVKQLGEQNLEKEREKQQLIAQQNEMLEKQVKEKTHEIQEQKDELEEKNKEITDSITYARRIQNAILPAPEMMAESLGEYLVVYKPKDVVSGDFYWCHSSGDKVIFAVADCTGHGVPGAFMSMIGNSILNEVVIDQKIRDADSILNELRSTLINTLQKSAGQTTRDGMDIALCVLNKKDNTLQYAGANNSLYWISENIAVDGGVKESEKIRLEFNNLLEVVADKQPVGYQEGKMDNSFTKHTIQLRKGDLIYITSDGYIDQFGGERNKKFTSKRFREMLASFVDKPITVQKQILENTIEQWKKYETQTDDICVIGIKI